MKMDERIRLAVADVLAEVPLGEALRRRFPEATDGSESPEMVLDLTAALTEYIGGWVALNVEEN